MSKVEIEEDVEGDHIETADYYFERISESSLFTSSSTVSSGMVSVKSETSSDAASNGLFPSSSFSSSISTSDALQTPHTPASESPKTEVVSQPKTRSRIAQIPLVSSHREVYEPCDDSFALVDALLADRTNLIDHDPKICMEIGCGSGYVITSLILLLNDEVSDICYLATDMNPIAARVTRETLEAHGVDADVICCDIASGLEKRLAGSVDVMVVNPPYVPTPEEEVGWGGIVSSWAGGENGRTVIDKILPAADLLLSENGWLYMVTLTSNNPSEICVMMRKKGYASRIALQRSTEEENLQIIKFWRDNDIQRR